MQLYWVALKSIWTKEIHRFMRIWVQTLVPPVITMTLYFVIFGNLIGSRIGEMHGFTYMQFIVPGLIMMAVITNAYANVASSFFSAKFQRNIEELLVAPVPTHVVIAGYVGGGVARGLCVGILVTAISLFFVPFGFILVVRRPDADFDGNPVLAGGPAQCGVCENLRRHQPDPDFRADTADLSWRGVLFADAVAAVLAGAVAFEPDRLHD